MTVRYEEILGTTANDTIVDGCGFVTLGLQGNDTINGIVGDNQLCLGGTGANTYNLVQSDIMTVVSINGGSDTIVAPDINLKASTTSWGLVNGKSLFFLDSRTGEAVIVVNDFRTDTISETFRFAGVSYSYNDILTFARSGGTQARFDGNMAWSGVYVLVNGVSLPDNLEAWQFYSARATTLEGGAVAPAAPQTFTSTSVNETFTGTAGVDTAVYSGSRAQYSITQGNGTVSVADSVRGRDGTDLLVGVEQVKFSDVTLAFDLTSAQDKLVYEIYQAAYARTPDLSGFRFWAQKADAEQTSATGLATAFLQSQEFTQKYGANPTNTAYITALYTNVLGRAPDQSGVSFWVGKAIGGESVQQLLVDFATSTENVTLIAPHVSNGFWLL